MILSSGTAQPDAPAAAAKRAWQLALLILAPIACYANSVGVPFFLDDDTSIVVNPAIGTLAAGAHEPATRRIAYLTFKLNHLLGGLDPVGYHVVNVAIHLLAGLAVFGLARRLLRCAHPAGAAPRGVDEAALAAALLFAVHPVQTQAVTYVAQRIASLAALFYAVAMLLYVVARTSASTRVRWGAIVGAVAATAASMKTKEIAFTLPFAILLLELAFFSGPRRLRAAFVAPFLALLAIIPLTLMGGRSASAPDFGLLPSAAAAGSSASRAEYAATQARVVVRYLELLVWPAGQNLDHDVPLEHGFGSLPVLASLALLLLLAAASAALLARARRPGARLAGAGGLLFFLGLSVESSVIPIADVMFEHRLYLPMIGVALAVAGALHCASSAWPGARRWLALGAATWLVGLGAATVARNHVWRDGVSLWSDVVEKSPRKPRAHFNLGEALRAVGRLEEAQRAWTRAVELDPLLSPAANQLGSLAMIRGDLATAERWYLRAIAGRPVNPEAFYNLALLLEATGRPGEAVALHRRFVDTAPPHLRAEAARVRARFGWR